MVQPTKRELLQPANVLFCIAINTHKGCGITLFLVDADQKVPAMRICKTRYVLQKLSLLLVRVAINVTFVLDLEALWNRKFEELKKVGLCEAVEIESINRHREIRWLNPNCTCDSARVRISRHTMHRPTF